jgi:hypothetical protein
MKPPTRFFLKAAVLALLISGAGFGYSKYQHSRTVGYEKQCQIDDANAVAAFKIFKEKNPEVTGQLIPLTCDPIVLTLFTVKDPNYVPSGVEGQLLSALNDENNGVDKGLYGIAALVALLGALPLAWYFFLARLTELVGAVRRS